jgi:hypothetical protein
MGWASLASGFASHEHSSTTSNQMRPTLLACIWRPGTHRSGRADRLSLQSSFGHVGIEQVKLRIQRDCAAQIILAFFLFTKTFVDHAGMKQQQRVFRSQAQRFLDGRGGLLRLRVLVQRPSQSIPGVNVVTNFKFFARQFKSLLQVNVVIGVEDG